MTRRSKPNNISSHNNDSSICSCSSSSSCSPSTLTSALAQSTTKTMNHPLPSPASSSSSSSRANRHSVSNSHIPSPTVSLSSCRKSRWFRSSASNVLTGILLVMLLSAFATIVSCASASDRSSSSSTSGRRAAGAGFAGSVNRVTRSVLVEQNRYEEPQKYAAAAALYISPPGDVHRLRKDHSFVFSCHGPAADAADYTDLAWYDPNGNKITPSKDFMVSLTNKADRLQLIFRKPTSAHNGAYTCRAKFQSWTNVETTANVMVLDGVSWEDCPKTQALVKGRDFETIRCRAESGAPADITWIKDESLPDAGRYSIESAGIRIKGVTEERDAGTYTIMATVQETGGLETREIIVEVHSKPVITDIADSVDAVEGESVELKCSAQAVPYATYSWIDASNRNLSDANGYTVNGETGVLRISKVSRINDRGTFKCIASNAAGQDERGSNLKIITKPVITRLESASVKEGDEAMISCTATGNPMPRLSIRRQGEESPLMDDKIRISVVDMPSTESNTVHVSIKGIQRADSSFYVCSADNQAGHAEQTSHLEVKFKPDLSRTPTTVMTWHLNVRNITCIVDAIPNATVMWYNDRTSQRISDDTRYRIFADPSGASSSLQVTATENSVYTDYQCQAFNQLGETKVTIALQEAFVPGVAEGIAVIKRSPQSVTFKYEPMAKNGGLPVIRYHVKYNEINNPSAQGLLSPTAKTFYWTVPSPSQALYLDGLKSEAEYEFVFAAENDVGIGEYGNQMTVYLPRESQPEPIKFHLDDGSMSPESGDLLSSYSREFKVRWNEPNDNGRKIDSYDIKYYKVKKSASSSQWIQDGDVFRSSVAPGDPLLTYTLSGLSPSSHYRVEVSARNALGSSHPSGLIFQTAGYQDPSEVDEELVMSSSNLIILITIFILAILLFLVILDLICCFGFNAGLIRCICGSDEENSSDGGSGSSSRCCLSCFGSSTRRSIRSGSSSIQKEDPEDGHGDHDHLNGHNNHHHNHHHHPPPHHHHVLNHPHAQARGDAV